MTSRLLWLALLLPSVGAAQPAPAGAPWDSEPMSADPPAIARAAAALRAEDASRQILLAQSVYRYEANGACEYRSHRVFRILTESGAAEGATIEARWSPWHQARPQVSARVITPDGVAHVLDPASLVDSHDSGPADVYPGQRSLRAPLPALTPGAVVEEELIIRETAPAFAAGTVTAEPLAEPWPAARIRVIVDAPVSLPVRYSVRGPSPIKPRTRVEAGRSILTFEVGPTAALSEPPAGAPLAELLPLVQFSTGKSWKQIAEAYARLVEPELAGGDRGELSQLVRTILGETPPRDPKQIAAALLGFMRREIRYTGSEFHQAAMVLHSPGETIARKYGDLKDHALLLTALLRAAGLTAQVALLRAQPVPEADESLPGFGLFDHLLVRVAGPTPLWIDPIAPLTRPGELPAADQDKLALLIDPATHGLVRTPTITAAANGCVNLREITLAETGDAHLVESLETRGAFDRFWRTVLAALDPKQAREKAARAIRAVYPTDVVDRFEFTDIHKLDDPFKLSTEITGRSAGYSDDTAARVPIESASFLADLPSELRQGANKRAVDYVMPEVFIHEWRYRIHGPVGFSLDPLPKDTSSQIGPLRFWQRFSRTPDGIALVEIRLELTGTRFRPEEVETLRAYCRRAEEGAPAQVVFQQTGRAHLEAGRVREALVEFRKLAALHPKEAQHHIQIADALLRSGLGEAARAEAARAVELEPSAAAAHRMRAWVLDHDLLGRWLHRGFDLAGSEAELRRAKALDPKDFVARRSLGIVLEHDRDAVRYGPHSRMADALAEFRAIVQDLGNHEIDEFALYDLMHLGRWKELRDAPDESWRAHPELLLAAVTVLDGAPAALARADSMESSGRGSALQNAAALLSEHRRYRDAASLLERAAQLENAPAWVAPRADVLRRLRRMEELPPPNEADAAAPVRRLYAELLRADDDAGLVARIRAVMAKRGPQLKDSDVTQFIHTRRSWDSNGLPLPVIRDALVGLSIAEKDGDERTGYRVRMQKPFDAGTDTYFVVREDGKFRLLAWVGDLSGIGRRVIDEVAAGHLEAGRRWLDWTAELLAPSEKTETPPVFTQIWKTSTSAAASAEVMRVAAAVLLIGRSTPDNQAALAVLRAAHTAPPPGAPAEVIELALARVEQALGDSAEVLRIGAALSAQDPSSRAFFELRSSALARLKRWDELRRAAEERLRLLPDERPALRALASADAEQQQWASSEKTLRRLVEVGRAESGDYNRLAWNTLFHDGSGEQALEDARRSVELGKRRGYGALHTLACVQAELGKIVEARATLLEAIELNNGEPLAGDHYVLGRIAESLGMNDVALAQYRQAKTPGESFSFSTSALAERHSRALERSP